MDQEDFALDIKLVSSFCSPDSRTAKGCFLWMFYMDQEFI